MARLDVAGSSPKKRKKRDRGPPTHAFSIGEFCDAHRISRAQYYKLKARGLAPAETRVLDKVIITSESAAAWRRKHTARAQARAA
jgi:hypothetical protein